MKLLECEIAGFGAFSNYHLTFTDGLNVILQPNGWGKTTLAAFIKAMFYGFDRKRVKNVEENERMRYMPWHGGKYGGSIDFEFEGKEYRVTRAFGRAPSADEVRLRDLETGKVIEAPDAGIGEWVFGLDPSAFQKSVFVNQNGFGFDGSTVGLRKRLSMLVTDEDDETDVEKALGVLDKARKHYKKTGNRGLISDLTDEQEGLLRQLNEYEQKMAMLDQLQVEASEIGQSLDGLDEQIGELQKQLKSVQESEKDLAALRTVRDQLVRNLNAAKDELERVKASSRGLPSDDELEEMRKMVAGTIAAREDLNKDERAKRAAEDSLKSLAANLDGSAPTKDQVDLLQQAVSEHAHQVDLVANLEKEQARFEKPEFVAMASNEMLVKLVDKILDGRQSNNELQLSISQLQDHITKEKAAWEASRTNVLSAKQQYEDLEGALEGIDESKAEMLAEQAKRAKQAAAAIVDLDSALSTKKSELAAEEMKAGIFVSMGGGAEEVASEIRSLSSSYENACKNFEKTSKEMETADSALQEAKDEVEKAIADVNEKKSHLIDIQGERAKAVNVEANARAAAADAKSRQKGSVGPIVLIVLGVLAVAAGFVIGFASVPSLVLIGVGAILLIVGAIFLVKKSSSQKAVSGQREAVVAEASSQVAKLDVEISSIDSQIRDLEGLLETKRARLVEVQDGFDVARSIFEQANKEKDDAYEALFKRVSDLSVGAIPSEENIFELAERVLRGIEDSGPVIASLDRMRAKIEEAEQKKARLLNDVLSEFGLEAQDGKIDLLHEYEVRLAESERLKSMFDDFEKARKRYMDAVAAALGTSADELSDDAFGLVVSDLPPSAVRQSEELSKAMRQVELYEKALDEVYDRLGIERAGDVQTDALRLEQIKADYSELSEQAGESGRALDDARAMQVQMKGRIDELLQKMGLDQLELPSKERLQELSGVAKEADELRWKLASLGDSIAEKNALVAEQTGALLELLSACGYQNVEDVALAVEDIAAQKTKLQTASAQVTNAKKQYDAWEKENAQAMQAAQEALRDDGEGGADARLKALQVRRDALLETRSQYDERQNALHRSLDDYLSVLQKGNLLSLKKQEAIAQLSTVLKTKEYLVQARANLDKRFMGGLSSRFDEYATRLLEGDELGVSVHGDFDVTVQQSGESHDVAAYSTGYKDVLDLCFRIALVDTIFEGERPFIVMDDPFVNLDQGKIVRCMALLALLATQTQIIYFACHPSRSENAKETRNVGFSLPPQRPKRESPREQAMREAQERAKAQAELIASYHIEPVTKGRASLMVADSKRVIGSNLFSVRFTQKPASGSKDNSFEVHFIDEQGRALSDRHAIEIRDGRIMPERVQFSFLTRPDSGSKFDLIIREEGREESVLADRVTYESRIAFTSQDFGF